jgi:hypothetical protein
MNALVGSARGVQRDALAGDRADRRLQRVLDPAAGRLALPPAERAAVLLVAEGVALGPILRDIKKEAGWYPASRYLR